MNGWEFLLNSLGGATAGYFTNYFAVKMLFRKYGPFGGYILKTKEEFIQSTSSLVEDKIINHHTIEEELDQGEFENIFRKAVYDILDKHIYNYVGDEKWSGIPAVSESLDHLKQFFRNRAPEYTDQMLSKLLTEIKVNDILSEKQVRELTANVMELSPEIIQDSDILKKFVLQFAAENRGKKLSTFYSEEMWDKLQEIDLPEYNLSGLLQENYDNRISLIFNNIFNQFDLPASQLEDSISGKTAADLFGYDNLEKLINKLTEELYNFTQTDRGQQIIDQLLQEILDNMKNIDVPLFSLFSKELQIRLEDFMKKVLPGLVEEGIKWIEGNEQEIEYLIEQSIDDVLESGTGIKNAVKKGIYSLFKGDDGGSLSVINKIISRLENRKDSIEDLSIEFANTFINYLKTNNVGEIMTALQERGFIKPIQLRNLLINRLEAWKGRLELSDFEELYMTRIGSLIELDLKDIFSGELKEEFVNQIKDKFLYTDRLEGFLNQKFRIWFKELGERQLAELLETGLVNDNFDQIQNLLSAKIEDKKEILINKLSYEINHFLEERYFTDLLDEKMKARLNTFIGEVLLNNLEELVDGYSQKSIKDQLDDIDKKEWSSELAEFLLELVNNNLPQILQGRIQRTVANSLGKLDDNDIQETVEEFMGAELRPITWLGAGLGGLVGIALYLITMVYDISLPLTTGLGLSSLTYGLIGFLTNVVALRMIFRPYNKKSILGLDLPFTPGVVAKNKPRFANSMGEFVHSELLNAETVSEIFSDKRKQLEEGFREAVSRDDYKLVHQKILDNSEFLADRLYGTGVYYLRHNEDQLAVFLVNKFAELDLSVLDVDSFNDFIIGKLRNYLINNVSSIAERAVKGIKTNQALSAVLPEGSLALISDWMEGYLTGQISSLSRFLGDKSNIKDILISYDDSFQEIKEKRLAELIPTFWQDRLSEELVDYLIRKLGSEEFSKEITDLLKKRFKTILYESKDMLIEHMYTGVINWLQGEGQEILKKETLTAIENEFEKKSEGGPGDTLINVLTRGFYHLTDTEETIKKVIDDLVDNKIPIYLDSEKEKVHDLITDFIDSLLVEEMDELGEELIQEGIDSIIKGVKEKDSWQDKLYNQANEVIGDLLQVKLGTLLGVLSIDSLSDLYHRFEDEIDLLRDSLIETLANSNQSIAQEITPLCCQVLEDMLDNISPAEFTEGWSEEEIREIIEGSLEYFSSSQALTDCLRDMLEKVMGNVLAGEPGEFIDLTYLKDDLAVTLSNTLYQKEIRRDFKKIIRGIINDLSGNLNKIIKPATRDYLLEIGLGSSLDSLEENMTEIINSINLEEITRREINEMDPSEIESLFYSFAGRYLTRLKLYGWLGGGFGVMARLLSLLGG